MARIWQRYAEFSDETAGLNGLINEFLKGKENLVGVEIGSFAGESAELFYNSGAFQKFFCIDPWQPGYDPNDANTGNNTIIAEKDFDERFMKNDVVVKIKLTSEQAINQFEDESIDFIYIDGNHRYEAVKQDLQNYFNKVKHGGMIAGHDYDVSGSIMHIRGVKKAIDEFFQKPPLKIYGDNSWIYIKE